MRLKSLLISVPLFFTLATQGLATTTEETAQEVAPCSDFSGEYQCTAFADTPSYTMTLNQTTNSDNVTVIKMKTNKTDKSVELIFDGQNYPTYIAKCKERSLQILYKMKQGIAMASNYQFSLEGDLRIDIQILQFIKDDWDGESQVKPLQRAPTAFCKKTPQS